MSWYWLALILGVIAPWLIFGAVSLRGEPTSRTWHLVQYIACHRARRVPSHVVGDAASLTGVADQIRRARFGGRPFA